MNIDTSGCAFKIADDSTGDVTITLADGTENTLDSGKGAGLQKNGGIGTLTINGGENGTGTLTATGGLFCAGIGGGGSAINAASSCSNIIINGGVITATGDYYLRPSFRFHSVLKTMPIDLVFRQAVVELALFSTSVLLFDLGLYNPL